MSKVKHCIDCGCELDEGEGQVFTCCEKCWDKKYPKETKMDWKDELEEALLKISVGRSGKDWVDEPVDAIMKEISPVIESLLKEADANARMEQDIINFNSWLEKEEKVMKIAKIDECQKILTDRSIFNMPTKIQNLLLERISELEGGSE